MEINGPFRGEALQNSVSAARNSVKTDKAQGTKSPHIGGSTSNQESSQTTTLLRLTEGLRQIPEVREDVVSRVQENLRSGQYLSKEAAQATAAAILKGQ